MDQGINKCISNATVIEIYNIVYQGITDHPEVIKEDVKELDEKELAPPPQCALNKNNIHTWGKAILNLYKSDN